MRYSNSKAEAQEIVNDGFLKVFGRIQDHQDGSSFKAWLRRIMINTSIDHFRRNEKHHHGMDIAYAQVETGDADSLGQLTEKEILRMVQLLPPAYRIVFNLYAIEGYKHLEIARMLSITEGTSKSNLAKARMKLRKMLYQTDRENFEQYG
jgi:RNA polymerase sigma-70 factor (ECF subfamily)